MAYTKDAAYDGRVMLDVMFQAKDIVRQYREWFGRESGIHRLHPFVEKAIEMCRPDNWQALLLSWPHESKSYPGDMTRVAFTRDEKSGIANKQVVTTLGKYLRAHFSLLPDDAIRDIVALAQSQQANFKFVHTTAEMIYHLHRGPGSCMQWDDSDGIKCDDGIKHHPYEAYDPALGWHMAIRVSGDDTVGRALCMDDGEDKFFVRSYKKTEGYSHADEQLEAWLRSQGYHKRDSWRGCDLKTIPTGFYDCGFLAPYLDGDYKQVELRGKTLRIVEDGDFECNNTDGSADECGGSECTNCGDRVRDGDGHWAGPWQDEIICEHCCDYSYSYVIGRNGRHYYVHEDNAVYVESRQEYYHDDYLDTNSIVQLANGDYEHTDNVVEVDGDYYHVDDERIVMCEDDEQYHLKGDVYYHEDSGNWYADEDNMPKDEGDEE